MYGASACPGETYQPAHSIWPPLETVDHLLHLNWTDSHLLGLKFMLLKRGITCRIKVIHLEERYTGRVMNMWSLTWQLHQLLPRKGTAAIAHAGAEVLHFLVVLLLWFNIVKRFPVDSGDIYSVEGVHSSTHPNNFYQFHSGLFILITECHNLSECFPACSCNTGWGGQELSQNMT